MTAKLSVKTKVLITGALHESALAQFKGNQKLDISYYPDCDRATLLKFTRETQVLVTRSETDVDKEVIDAGVNLKVIARAAVGVH